MEAKQGSAYWIQQWYTRPRTELIVEMTNGESIEEDGRLMPPVRKRKPPQEKRMNNPMIWELLIQTLKIMKVWDE